MHSIQLLLEKDLLLSMSDKTKSNSQKIDLKKILMMTLRSWKELETILDLTTMKSFSTLCGKSLLMETKKTCMAL